MNSNFFESSYIICEKGVKEEEKEKKMKRRSTHATQEGMLTLRDYLSKRCDARIFFEQNLCSQQNYFLCLNSDTLDKNISLKVRMVTSSKNRFPQPTPQVLWRLKLN